MTIFDNIGNTPTFKIEDEKNDIYLKYEGANSFGSSKDRSAKYVLNKLYNEGTINKDTTIIESSSGNMGIALAATCKHLGNKFICVIDPHISAVNEFLIKNAGAETIKVTEADSNNSYLKTRLKVVGDLLKQNPNSYWFNQYGNPLVCEAYEEIGREIVRDVQDVEYVFVAVSSAGTIGGVSKAIKEYAKRQNRNIKVIAVDVEGSKVFDINTTKKRYLSGIGSSIQSVNLSRIQKDDVILVDEKDGVRKCYELWQDHTIFAGGSSGCVVEAIEQYVKKHNIEHSKIVGLLNDRGDRYFKTVYDEEWVKEKFGFYPSEEIKQKKLVKALK